jgi:hypothetical protein
MWRSRKTHVPPWRAFSNESGKMNPCSLEGSESHWSQKIFVRPIDPKNKASFSLHRNVNDLLVDLWTESNQMLRYQFEEITKASLCYKAKETSRIL